MTQEIIVAIIGSGALSALVANFFGWMEKRKEKDDAIMLMLYHDIKMECKDYIAQEYIDSDGLEVLIKMHTTYHKRGGNGFLDKLMDQVKKLPIRD